MDCPLEILADFEEIITILDTLSTNMLKGMARRVEYFSIPVDEVCNIDLSLTREERKKIYLFLAVYGNGLSSAGCIFTPSLGATSVPASLFSLLLAVVGVDNAPIELVTQTVAMMQSLVYGLSHNDHGTDGIKAMLATSYLEKQYAD